MLRSLRMPVSLQMLPIEIICHIFSNLDMPDLLACSKVTKHLRRVVMNSSQLQYTIELGKHRVVSLLPASTGPSFSTRLNLLRDRERAWKYMDWKKKDTLRLPPTGSVYEFVGGLYGNGREDDRRVTASISFLELPSTDASFLGKPEPELQMWTHAMGDITIVDFTMDPSQDLLVLVALAPSESRYIYELHLRSIKTNQPHPKAPVSALPCLRKPTVHLQTSDIVAAVRVQVAGNLVALLIKEAVEGTSAHLEIWNWETSPQFSCAMARADGIDDFTFLSHDSFLLVLPPGQFEVYTFTSPLHASTVPVLRVIYAFPPLSEGYLYWYISMSSNPAPGYVPRRPTDQDGQPSMPGKSRQVYYPRPDERIHACCLYIFNPSGEENQHVHSFVFFLNLQTLLNPPAEWFSEPAPPRPTTDTHSPPSGSPSMAIHRHVNSFPFTSSIPGSSSSQLSSVESSTSANTHLPSYPPFPTFDSLMQDSAGQASTEEISAPPAPEGPSPRLHLATRRCGPRSSLRPVATIPWDVWGPQSTRWFPECLSTDWQHAVYGLRTVESVDPGKLSRQRPPLGGSSGHDVLQVPSAIPKVPSHGGPNYMSLETQTNTAGSSSSSSSSSGSGDSQPADSDTQPTEDGKADESQGDGDDSNADEGDRARRFLRIRDFNPYSFANAAEPSDSQNVDGKGKGKAHWRGPRLVRETSRTPVNGVFQKDIVSSLPYVEVISAETFEVTDVMMDDCRLLLLKVRLALGFLCSLEF
ncbi:hypothetical protein GALMADRAFT_62654 [Galerina marginata CBS 339.88]|uniref:F-box domain-containing protein n=1 Tax=Galerina marginata (strain CBS 339.88) TaxID=685588 RepID=A0A067TA58_GALM3|nr:hypothetical protein GALMADRAFT_62654 [Galerina marginata CBS 339.88]